MTHRLIVSRWLPTRANQLRGHWAEAARLKRVDRDLIAGYVAYHRLPVAVGRRRVTLNITLSPKCRGTDPDAWWKSLLDALTHAGMLVDDSSKWCELGPVTVKRGKEKGTEILLDDVEDVP